MYLTVQILQTTIDKNDLVKLKALIEKKQRYSLCPVGDRAMAYHLVRSGLDNAGYRRVYNSNK